MAEEKVPKPKPDIVRDLWKEQARLKLHLTDGMEIKGKIKQLDQYNLQVAADDNGKQYWIPKHAVVYAEIL